MENLVVAICYDFDRTLASCEMQAFSFIPKLGMTSDEFWKRTNTFSKETGTDPILSFLRMMIECCREKNIKLTREYLIKLGKDIKFYDGVTTWFKRMNDYAEKQGIKLEHYIISSGNKEIIEGSSIFKEFKNVFGCEFLYDKNGEAYWLKNIVNYTLKTQYLFRICKGASDLTDEYIVNQRINKKHVEFRNMIYIGDGSTDIPCMTLIKEKGGTAISVFAEENIKTSAKLVEDERVNYACKSDYRAGSKLDKFVKLVIDSIALREKLQEKQNLNKR